MLKPLFLALCCGLATQGHAMVCRAAPIRIEVTFTDTACLIDSATTIRRDIDGAVECLLSNPQLRIITIFPDGRFVYEDTDDDRVLTGTCTPD